jgi:hypothetical protein
MKAALLTNGNLFCTLTLNNISDIKNISSLIILIEFPLHLKYYYRKNEKKNLFQFLKVVFRFFQNLYRICRFIGSNLKFISKIRIINSVKSKSSVIYFQKQNFDYIFLAGMSIIQEEIINSAKTAVVNCHPALVPNVRGLDVIYHSVLNMIPPFISIHKVDKGIDTGELIQAHLVPINLLDTNDYEKLCLQVYDYASKLFSFFIIEVLGEDSGGVISKVELIKYPRLEYCKVVSKKNTELFFENLLYLKSISCLNN